MQFNPARVAARLRREGDEIAKFSPLARERFYRAALVVEDLAGEITSLDRESYQLARWVHTQLAPDVETNLARNIVDRHHRAQQRAEQEKRAD